MKIVFTAEQLAVLESTGELITSILDQLDAT